jgi:tetratricopeptide (TPR) repeat protein
MDIAIVAVLASFVAFRLIRMTTGKQAAAPLDRKKFLGYMIALVLLFSYCGAAVLVGAGWGRPSADEKRLAAMVVKANALLDAGRANESAAVASEAVALAQRAFGPADPKIPAFLDLEARCRMGQKKYAEAEALYRRALGLRAQAHGENHPDTAVEENNLGTLYVEMGRDDQAEACFKRALARTERVMGKIPAVLPVVLDNLAKLCDRAGRVEEAKSFRERAKGYRPGP